MRNFAFGKAETIPQAAAAAGLVAEAMLAPDGGARSEDVRIVKAGGIDLIDLMKEGLLAPSEVTSLRPSRASTRSRRRLTAGLSVGPMVTLARLASDPTVRDRYPALADAAGESASPQIRAVATIGGNLLQRPRCWYFRAVEFRCLRKGGGHCYAISGENQYHAIFDNRFCAIVHPSTSATALVALGAEIELTDADGGTRRRVALEDFFVGPDRDVQRENDLKAERTPHRRSAAARRGSAHEADEARAEGIVRLAAGRCRGRSRSRPRAAHAGAPRSCSAPRRRRHGGRARRRPC